MNHLNMLITYRETPIVALEHLTMCAKKSIHARKVRELRVGAEVVGIMSISSMLRSRGTRIVKDAHVLAISTIMVLRATVNQLGPLFLHQVRDLVVVIEVGWILEFEFERHCFISWFSDDVAISCQD